MIETLDFSADGYMVYYIPLPPTATAAAPSPATTSTAAAAPSPSVATTSTPQSRREREQSARRRLVAAILGDGVEISHHPDGSPYIAATSQPSASTPSSTSATPSSAPSARARPISISHSPSTLALAVATTPSITIGIDVEAPRQQLERTASRYLSTDEKSRLATLVDPAERIDFLLRCWTAKEAVYKAARTPGLPLASIVTDRDFLTATVSSSPSTESAAPAAAATYRRYALTYHRLPTAETLCIAKLQSES